MHLTHIIQVQIYKYIIYNLNMFSRSFGIYYYYYYVLRTCTYLFDEVKIYHT